MMLRRALQDLHGPLVFFPCVLEDLGTVSVVTVFGLNIWTAYSIFILKFKHSHMPDTQLDVNPTCDQEITGSTPAGSATFFRVN